jgi:hypothetical protein
MSEAARRKWAFTTSLRARAFGWRGSAKAVACLREAVAEIKAAQRRDPAAAGEGVVRLAERIWPAFEQIDTSSGALGGAVNRALDTLIPILIAAPAGQATRSRWLERLFDAIQDDGVEYLMPISERFGEIAVFPTLRNLYADRTIGMIRASWSDRTPGGYVAAQTLCLSCLLEAGRYDELCDLLALRRVRFWHDERFAAEALLRQGREEEALAHAEALLVSERPTYDARRIAAFCETVLTGLGRREEAYRRFALPHASGATYLATWRALARRYPERQGREVLVDLIAARGQKGKWFAAAKAAGDLDLALECAADHEAEPSALVRAARDFQESDPRFAASVALAAVDHLLSGRGYEPKPADMEAAMAHLRAAAERLGVLDEARRTIEVMLTPSRSRDLVMERALGRMMSLFSR